MRDIDAVSKRMKTQACKIQAIDEKKQEIARKKAEAKELEMQ